MSSGSGVVLRGNENLTFFLSVGNNQYCYYIKLKLGNLGRCLNNVAGAKYKPRFKKSDIYLFEKTYII